MYDGSSVGLLNMLALRLGLSHDLIQWLGNYNLALWAVVVAVVWASTPFWAMMFLAGLQAIPGELYEAAEIDGADVVRPLPTRHVAEPGQRHRHHRLLSTIWTATSINFVYVLTNGGPAGATMTFPMLAYQIGVAGAQRLGMGATISLVFFPIFLVMIYFLTRRMLADGALSGTLRARAWSDAPSTPAVCCCFGLWTIAAALLDRRHSDQAEPADLSRAVAVPEPGDRRPFRLRADADAVPACTSRTAWWSPLVTTAPGDDHRHAGGVRHRASELRRSPVGGARRGRHLPGAGLAAVHSRCSR